MDFAGGLSIGHASDRDRVFNATEHRNPIAVVDGPINPHGFVTLDGSPHSACRVGGSNLGTCAISNFVGAQLLHTS